jgi:flagellar secretion chaperone FliS
MTNAHTAYREAGTQGATGVRLVVLMYEQMIQDLSKAAQAMDDKNIEYRSNRINHVLDVLCVLEGTLDFERGGQIAHNLQAFYQIMRANLWHAQLNQSKEALIGLITDLFALREAWTEVDRAELAVSGTKPALLTTAASDVRPTVGASNGSDEHVPGNWKG